MYYIGIDSGGTKTAFTVIDEFGNVKLEFQRGTGHYMHIGFDGFKKLHTEALGHIYNELNIGKESIAYIFMGIPGYGEVKSDGKILKKIISEIFSGLKYTVGNDVESGWAGSLACQPGINVVCGTGSIVIGVNEKNEIARSGGWGEFVGDEASAYWIAKKAIEVYSKQSDFRLKRTIFYKIFKENLNLNYDFELIDILQNKYKLSRSKVAKISIIASKIASLGDEYAIKIFEEAAHEIYLMINSIIKQLDFKEKIKVSYTGGVFKSEDLILNPLKIELVKNKINIEIIKPILRPTIGSALYAYKLAGNNITHEIIKNLKKQDYQEEQCK